MITSLSLSATALTATNAEGDSVRSVPLDGGSTDVVALLSDVLGSEPTIHQEEAGCGDDRGITTWHWGDGSGVGVTQWEKPSSNSSWRTAGAIVVSLTAPALAGIELTAATGGRVGDSATGLFDGLPSNRLADGYGGQIGITELGGEYAGSSGTRAWGLALDDRDGLIGVIRAPSDFGDFFC